MQLALCTVVLYEKAMLTQLFSSKTRIKLLMKLFLNPQVSSYLRELAKEFEVSPNAIKTELDSLSQAGYLEREQNGRSVYFKANTKHPFFPEISSIVRKTLGIDGLLDEIVSELGDVHAAYILDDYAMGRDSGIIDVLVVGDINRDKLEHLRQVTEKKISRTVRPLAVTPEDFERTRDVFLKRPHWKIL